jgi:hypothetical protein
MEYLMSTGELAQVTGVELALVLDMLDMGVLAGRARLVRGRPMFNHDAIAVVQRTVRIADEATAAGKSAAEAWGEILKQTT